MKEELGNRITVSQSGAFEIKTRLHDKRRTVQVSLKYVPVTTMWEDEAFEMTKALEGAFCFYCGRACGKCIECRVLGCDKCSLR